MTSEIKVEYSDFHECYQAQGTGKDGMLYTGRADNSTDALLKCLHIMSQYNAI